MIKNLLFFVILASLCSKTYSQNNNETCESDQDDLFALNSITKCTIKEADGDSKKKEVSFQVTSRRNIKRKRNTTQSIASIDANEVSAIKNTSNITNQLSFKKVEKTSNAISFYKIEEIPLFKECERAPLYDQKKCFKKQMARHIKLNLNYPNNSRNKGIQGRVLANVIIDKNGKTNIINTLYPYKGEELREEAIRIIEKLPNFIPGKQASSQTDVQYSLKIVFNIPGVAKTNIRKENTINDKIYTFSEVEKIPEFKNCSNETNNLSDCFTKELQHYVMNNFAYPSIAVENNIQGSVLIKFVIDSEGKVTNISTEGEGGNNSEILNEAAKRLVKKLPTFKPATKNGTPVNTKYQFPIKFSLEDS